MITRTQVARRRWVTALAGLVAVWAYAGVVGLVGGGIDFGAEITARLPADSPVLAGIALLLVVAFPCTAAAVLAWRRSPYAKAAAVLAGVALIGWIVVQIAVIQALSWMQFVFGLAGIVLVLLGERLPRRGR